MYEKVHTLSPGIIKLFFVTSCTQWSKEYLEISPKIYKELRDLYIYDLRFAMPRLAFPNFVVDKAVPHPNFCCSSNRDQWSRQGPQVYLLVSYQSSLYESDGLIGFNEQQFVSQVAFIPTWLTTGLAALKLYRVGFNVLKNIFFKSARWLFFQGLTISCSKHIFL